MQKREQKQRLTRTEKKKKKPQKMRKKPLQKSGLGKPAALSPKVADEGNGKRKSITCKTEQRERQCRVTNRQRVGTQTAAKARGRRKRGKR